MVRKWFALASLTATACAIATAVSVGCTSTEVVTVPGPDAGATVSPLDSGVGTKPSTGDDDDTTTDSGSVTKKTCLDTDPIDQTKVPYEPANPPLKAACTTQELDAISTYYKLHGGQTDFSVSDWEGSVSAGCASCAFTDDDPNDPPHTWGPILVNGNQLENVDQGGCVQIVSGSAVCGKAWQQFQVCLVQACLVNCQTQTQLDACRGDTTVLTTACKNAADAVKTACGSSIQTYESQCNGTNFTFEGAVKVSCIAAPSPPDAGAPDAGDGGP